MRALTFTLAGLIAVTQGSLWFGKGSVPHVMSMQQQLQAQRSSNEASHLRNQRLAAEVIDLREGMEMVEQTARRELGMVRPDEVLVQYTGARR